MSRIGICGIAGRMGRSILQIIRNRGHVLAAAFESESSPYIGRDAGELIHCGPLGVNVSEINEKNLREVDGLIDFSSTEASLRLLGMARNAKKPIVIGTTGFSVEEKNRIMEASSDVPVLFSPNMSIGVNLLFKLTEIAAACLKNEYDIEIFEAHHRFKKDSPSGTAKRLLEIIKKTVPELNNAKEITGRNGIVGERSENEIGVMAMRGGSIVGEHTVYFVGMEEQIELTHKAASRDAFAKGAVLAVEYIIGKKPALYNIMDVLGI